MKSLELSKLKTDSLWEMNIRRRYVIIQDLEFVIANKVTHVINTASKTIPNHWEPIGVVYLCYQWEDNDSQVYSLYR